MDYIYAALLLHKLGKEVTEADLKKVVIAAAGEVDESKIKSLVASLKGVDIASELANASMVASPVAAAPAAKTEEKPKEEKKEAAAEGLSALFG